jgi:hypothetical protein
MKKLLFTVLLLISFLISKAQEHKQIFSLTPVAKNVSDVNGLAIGAGLMWSYNTSATINGINIELNPITPFIVMHQEPEKNLKDSIRVTVNGLHISTAGFSRGVVHNGMGISIYNVTAATNGLNISVLYNCSNTLNGLHISGIVNSAKKGAGVLIAPVNTSLEFKGLQLGLYNESHQHAGIQIGLVNYSKTIKGLQIGLWNINAKRSLPFINW